MQDANIKMVEKLQFDYFCLLNNRLIRHDLGSLKQSKGLKNILRVCSGGLKLRFYLLKFVQFSHKCDTSEAYKTSESVVIKKIR